jgi:hypothetical protein
MSIFENDVDYGEMIYQCLSKRCYLLKWLKYVAFAVLGLVAGVFVAIHPLSEQRQPAQIGLVDQMIDDGRQTARETRDDENIQTDAVDSGSRDVATVERRGIEEEAVES